MNIRYNKDTDELKCFDCNLGYDDCECGTDSEEYVQNAADVAYEEEYGDNYMNGELGDGFFDYGPGE